MLWIFKMKRWKNDCLTISTKTWHVWLPKIHNCLQHKPQSYELTFGFRFEILFAQHGANIKGFSAEGAFRRPIFIGHGQFGRKFGTAIFTVGICAFWRQRLRSSEGINFHGEWKGLICCQAKNWWLTTILVNHFIIIFTISLQNRSDCTQTNVIMAKIKGMFKKGTMYVIPQKKLKRVPMASD